MSGLRRRLEGELSQQAAISGKDCGVGSSRIGHVLRIALEAGDQKITVGKSRELEGLEVGVEAGGRRGSAVGRKVQHIDLRVGCAQSRNLIKTAIRSGREGIGAVELELRNGYGIEKGNALPFWVDLYDWAQEGSVGREFADV